MKEIVERLMENHRVDEMISDSMYKEPQSFTIQVPDDCEDITDKLKSVTLRVEVLMKDDPGKYVLCVPGLDDWKTIVKKSLESTCDMIIS